MTSITEQKRQNLLNFVEIALKPYAPVQAVIGVGSIAMGQMRPDSDIDTLVFLDPYDRYIVPTEFMWMPDDGSFHSIFSHTPRVQAEGIQIECIQFDLSLWADPNHRWPEGQLASLQHSWTAFDRTGFVSQLIQERTAYPEATRIARLDRALVEIDGHLKWDEPQSLWQSLGPTIAHDRLQAAYGSWVQALFAYNRQWQPWRNREMSYLLRLPWLPENCQERILIAAHPPSHEYDGYVARWEMLNALFDEIVAQLVDDGSYEEDAISQAFIRMHDEPGRAWNMDDWTIKHQMNLGDLC